MELKDIFREVMLERAWRDGHEAGVTRGKRLGVSQTQRAVAIRLIQERCDAQFISQITGLMVPQIKRLRMTLN